MDRDLIEVTSQEWDKMADLAQTNKEFKYNIYDVSLPSFKVRVNHDGDVNTYLYDYNIDKHEITFECVSMIKVKAYFHYEEDGLNMDIETIYCDKDYHDWWFTETAEHSYDKVSKYAPIQIWVLGFFYVQWYLYHLPSIFIKDTVEIHKQPSKRQRAKGNRKSIVYLINRYKLNANYDHTITSSRVYTKECWGVRGHERHLKDGRVVKVKYYRKGKERNNPNVYCAKDYIPTEVS